MQKKLKKGEKKARDKGGYLRLKKGRLARKNNKLRLDDQFYVEYIDPRKLSPKSE